MISHTNNLCENVGFNLTFGNLKIKIYFTEINLIHTSLQRFHIKQSSLLLSFSTHSVWLFYLDRTVLFLGEVFEVKCIRFLVLELLISIGFENQAWENVC